MSFNIRVAVTSDLPALMALEQQLFTSASSPLSLNAFRYHIRAQNKLFVAETQGTIAGYILVFFYAKNARIYSLGVSRLFQGQGIGKALVAFACAQASQRKCQHLTLEVRKDNMMAYYFYQRLGFMPLKTLSAYYPDGMDGIKMRLTILNEQGITKTSETAACLATD